MAATLTTAIPRRSMSLDPIWGGFTSSLVVPEYARVTITPASVPTAANDGETLTIEWGGTSLTFTFSSSPGSDPLKLPVGTGSETIDEYLVILAEAFRQCEQIYTEWNVLEFLTANDLRLIYRTPVAVDVTASETMTFGIIQAVDSNAPETESNLRLLTEVFTDADNPASLGQQHSPYRSTDSKTEVDFSHHFAHLKPHLPTAASISAFAMAEASSAYQHWYIRYADKYGSPPQAEKMTKSPSYVTFYGSQSAFALRNWADENRRHNYYRRDGQLFWKPIGTSQPDWLYFYSTVSGSNFGYRMVAYYLDGTSLAIFNSTPFSLAQNTLYWFASGPAQININFAADTDNPVTRYEFRLVNYDSDFTIFSAYYELDVECADWGMYLLIDNGLGGCETVRLRGIKSEGYEVTGDVFQKIRTENFTVADGDFDKTNLAAQTKWTANSGYYSDDYYLDHLRQLPLSSKAWLVDVENERFLKVMVDASPIDTVREDDQDLYFINFEITAGWFEQAANV